MKRYSDPVFLLAILLSIVAVPAWAQEPPATGPQRWEPNIAKFEQSDQQTAPQPGGVVFIGSSSIRMWDVARWFPDQPALNRGFGGSEIADVNHFAERIVFRYEPKSIVFYAGDNDISRGKSAQQVAADFRAFSESVQQRAPHAHLIYVPIKPSLARWELWPRMQEANALIRRVLDSNFRWHYADIATPMLGADGNPRAELFKDDGLHLNEEGYKLWTGIVQPYLGRAEAVDAEIASGVVFHDANRNGRFEAAEPVLPNVRVSNGRDIVRTDAQGRYRLPVDDDTILFVIKPSGFRTRLDENKLPRFYYIHKPQGSPESAFPGVAPTGPLPESVDFPLVAQQEPDQFQAILFGDPQPRDQKEVDYIAHDVIEELVGTQASFGVTLGDITFDDLTLFEPLARSIAVLGIPWFNVIGNHDLNYDARDDRHSDETFERVFGPSYYSFDYGTVHFVVLDNVEWFVEEGKDRGSYRGGLGPDQLEYIRNDLAMIPEKQLVVLLMHVPLPAVHDREPLYRLIEQRPFCLSIAGHQHYHEHRFITDKDGWRGPQSHHHIINVTVCGSWWGGKPDERGIPHATMSDGAPNGYSIITFDGNEYTLDFKAAGRPDKDQMSILLPEVVSQDQLADTDIYVNVYNGSERSTVEMRIGESDDWTALERTVMVDPAYLRMVKREEAVPDKTWRNLARPHTSSHLWHGRLLAETPPGTHAIQFRTKDMHGRIYTGHRILRVTAKAPAP